jgi:eukaryotic-like serine/threonine-protein kinase
MALLDGQIYAGRYRVVRKLGDGAMGAVYEAENVLIRRNVAIKVLHPHVAERHDALRRFEREAQAAGRIGSPHIVEVLDMGQIEGGARFLVMELLEGVTLAQRIRDAGRLPPEEAAGLVMQLLAGLGAAHAADIVHRDLKPANVFLVGRGGGDYVKILDFGVSKFAVAGDDMGMTGAGSVLGTPLYMSPEQAKGARHVDHRSDLYAVGVLLYECVTGKVPFEAETFNELIFRIVLEAPPPIESVVPDLDPAFVAIVHKAMAREVGERYQTAREMHDALAHWLAPERAGVGLDTSSALLWAAAPSRSRGRKSGERALVLGLLVTLLLGAVTIFSMGETHSPPVAVRPPHTDLPSATGRPRGAAAPTLQPAPPPPVVPPPVSASASASAAAAPASSSAQPASSARIVSRVTRPAIVAPPKLHPAVAPGPRTVPDEL